MIAENIDVERSRAEYLENLWWLMHHSDSPDRTTMALTSYYDDSGSDDSSPITAIGGPVMSREDFLSFDNKWSALLHRHRIPPPLHMTDFVRPHGKHIGLHKEMKLDLFAEAVGIINDHKLFSVSVGIPQLDFKLTLPKDARKQLLSPYTLAFFCAVMTNQGVCKRSNRLELETISYLVDDGSSCKDQLKDAHTWIMESEKAKGQSRHTGSMAFDTDDRVSALQAADVIAWSARRREIDGQLKDEFEPLAAVLAQERPVSSKRCGPHAHISIPLEGIEAWAKPIINWICRTGKIPSFVDFLR